MSSDFAVDSRVRSLGFSLKGRKQAAEPLPAPEGFAETEEQKEVLEPALKLIRALGRPITGA